MDGTELPLSNLQGSLEQVTRGLELTPLPAQPRLQVERGGDIRVVASNGSRNDLERLLVENRGPVEISGFAICLPKASE
jgi:hypothetical protein